MDTALGRHHGPARGALATFSPDQIHDRPGSRAAALESTIDDGREEHAPTADPEHTVGIAFEGGTIALFETLGVDLTLDESHRVAAAHLDHLFDPRRPI